MGRTRKVKEKVFDLSCGLLAGVTDLVLFCLFQSINIGKYGGRTSYAVGRSIDDSIDEVISLGIDKEAIKKAIWYATHRKLLKKNKDTGLREITKEGRERIGRIMPFYQEKRTWNGHFYLITYDIEERKRQDRDILRGYLKRLGCGLLQDSVWLTPYNPKNILHDFVKERNLSGAIIVSDVGKDGSVGEESIEELISRVYRLESLNIRYKKLIDLLEGKKIGPMQARFEYLSILQDDPQLPFEILPYGWLGDKAYQVLNENLRDYFQKNTILL